MPLAWTSLLRPRSARPCSVFRATHPGSPGHPDHRGISPGRAPLLTADALLACCCCESQARKSMA